MRIKEILAQDKPVLSFEVFPSKEESAFELVEAAAFEIAKLSPAFMSVTYGAGGGTSKYTVDIASDLKEKFGVTALAHLTCVSSSREHVHHMVERLKERDIHNIMALRGDIPKDGMIHQDYKYATDQIVDLIANGVNVVHVYSMNKPGVAAQIKGSLSEIIV